MYMLDNEDVLEPMTTQENTRLNLPDGVPPLTSLYLYISGSCNLACKHCWIIPKFQLDGVGGPYIKLEHVEKAIREGKPLGLSSIKLTGGEPMLHPQFRELVTLINESDLDIIIETNGTLVDNELAQFLKSNSHVHFISVSLDGATAGVHEALRTVQGSYKSALDGIEALIRAGFHPQIIFTLHRGNVSEMADIVALANQLGCGSVKFNHVQSIGRGENFAEQEGLGVSEILQLYNYLEKEIIPNSHIPLFFDVPYAFFSLRKLVNDHLGRCTVQNILGMLAGGELSLCGIGTTVPELLYGHIEKDNLKDVWTNSIGLQNLRALIPSQLEGVCGQCIHRDFCQGECVANNFHTFGRLNAPFYFCDQAESLGLFPEARKMVK